jgi:hypothetical protein
MITIQEIPAHWHLVWKDDNVALIVAPQQQTVIPKSQSVKDTLELVAILLEQQRFMALQSTKTYTAEELRIILKDSMNSLAKQLRNQAQD